MAVGSGEGGLEKQSPMLFIDEICRAGVTTVVGCLGVDTTMKTLPGLLARVKALRQEGLTTYLWTGGYNIPPTTMLGDVRQDMMFIEECIGAGEVAISDEREMESSRASGSERRTDSVESVRVMNTRSGAPFHVAL